MLAAGTHAFLRRCGTGVGPLFGAGEHRLERHHPGIGEHQRRIVARNEGRRRHQCVAVLGEVVEEGRPDIVDAVHCLSDSRENAGMR